MAVLDIPNVVVRGISVCVPRNIEENKDFQCFHNDDFEKFLSATGIERRRIASPGVCASDLCFEAARKIICELNWEASDIDCLIFVSQTPDYILPSTSCILQDRLGISKNCFSLDISLGCSGWVYGMTTIASLLQSGRMKRGLLLVGDTLSRTNSFLDKTTWPLFSDAGSATALEYHKNEMGFKAHLASDGNGFKSIIIPDGGYRNGFSEDSMKMQTTAEGVTKCRLHGDMDGMDVFSFAISQAPKSIKTLLEEFSIDKDSIDYFVFHQANYVLNEQIRKKMKLNLSKVPYSLKNFGNTSGASIPLTLVSECRDILKHSKLDIVACGFGVGLSWGSICLQLDHICCPPIVEL
ncbi:MAG: ketoacyl-ACP synthase III [Bacteroidales bacterium]